MSDTALNPGVLILLYLEELDPARSAFKSA
jgi:hypothetical protein